MQTIDEVKKHCRVVGEGIVEYHAAEGRREAMRALFDTAFCC